MTTTTSWGIIGPGKIAKKFAAALGMVEGATLRAVASRDAARAAAFAKEYGAAASCSSYEELVSDPAIDAVYIATPHGFHAEHAILCLRHGKAVLCEKPLALSAHEVSAMVAASRESGAFLMEAMWTRFIPLMQSIRELIDSGAIGAIKYIRADFGFPAPFNPEGRLYNMRLGGGSLLDIGIYPLFLCTQLLGRPARITAAGDLSPTGSDVTCHAVLQYGDGASAVISSTLACQTSITAEIAGTEAMIRIPTPWYKNDRYEWSRTGEPSQPVTLEPMVNGFEYQIRETMRCRALGLIESPMLPHSFSLMMAETMDEIRRQIGVKYPEQ
ncbi:MAG TPA: Gfo/Idh/MocA family oxidoreductase [Puia sp.]|uniref:Gfo/Idh/MocA family protein n=1 Tax=Puia sp. TaxID=2045100 RepID=UPI002C9D7736|nr:Gfo/Idh/MocA family oxidoreductase [Puia sp.]HVU98207.1 Gfo/Idh/MocA family oxidoreductase [Puia sp.]